MTVLPVLIEIVVQCRSCFALETLYVNGDRLEPTKRFRQDGNLIYHDCRGRRPCWVISKCELARKDEEG